MSFTLGQKDVVAIIVSSLRCRKYICCPRFRLFAPCSKSTRLLNGKAACVLACYTRPHPIARGIQRDVEDRTCTHTRDLPCPSTGRVFSYRCSWNHFRSHSCRTQSDITDNPASHSLTSAGGPVRKVRHPAPPLHLRDRTELMSVYSSP